MQAAGPVEVLRVLAITFGIGGIRGFRVDMGSTESYPTVKNLDGYGIPEKIVEELRGLRLPHLCGMVELGRTGDL